tara:strand:- start:449 stop:1081 length:633 start_codon:yes stop_codon:yes gene_type:complete
MEARNESLMAMFPPVAASFVGASWIDTNGYIELGGDGLLFTSTIDLNGWTMNDFTFGTVQTQYQDPGVYSSDAASAKTEVIEIITDVPINLAALEVIKDNLGLSVPGMLGSAQDFATILYGNYRLYVPNLSLAAFPGFLQLISSGSFGSKEPTASSELYCYRIIKCAGAPGELLQAPACRIGLFGAFYREGDIEYMMRLKRSYELQQLQS